MSGRWSLARTGELLPHPTSSTWAPGSRRARNATLPCGRSSILRPYFRMFGMVPGCSVSTFALQQHPHGLEQDHDVIPDGPILDVPLIVGNALRESGVAAAADLPE